MDGSTARRSFDLLYAPWIPIAGVGDVSLTELFKNREYVRLGGTPVEKVVILRFLLCIAHASTPLPDVDAWSALTPEKLAANALEYLEKWKDRFDLYDEKRPFLQFPQLRGQCEKSSPNALSLNVASGNKTVLTQWSAAKECSDAELVRLILCGSGYGMGGGKYDLRAKVDPNTIKRKKDTGKASAPQGTLTGYIGYLHSFLLGSTILETVRLNMLTEEDLRELRPEMPLGRPFWEEMPTDENGVTAKRYSSGYLGILFPMDKFFCLEDDALLMTQGISNELYPSHKNGQWDPGITLYLDKKDMKARWCSMERTPWRQLTGLLQFINTKDTMPAFVVRGTEKFRHDPKIQEFGLWAGGVAISTNSGEQYVSGKNDYVNSEFLIPMEWFRTNSWEVFGILMDEIERYASILWKSVTAFYSKQMVAEPGQRESAVRLFWERMEPQAQSVIELSEETDPEVVENAKKSWQKLAVSCYREFCPCVTPRQMQAYVQCMPNFSEKKETKEKKKKEGKK